MKLTIGIVTYGNRAHLVDKILKPLIEIDDVIKVVILDNGSSNESARMLNALSKSVNKIKIYRSEKNLGSAGGFKKVIDVAFNKEDATELLLLDDDNLISTEAVKALKELINELSNSYKKNSFAISLIRPDRKHHERFLQTRCLSDLEGENNSFISFSLSQRFFRCFKRYKINESSRMNERYALINSAPYGGFYFTKKIFEHIGLPDESFYLYCDDTEYTHRVSYQKFPIFMSFSASIKDIDESWNFKKYPFWSSSVLFASELQTKYYFRNRVYFEMTHRVDSKVIYILNAFIYLSILFFKSIASRRLGKFKQVLNSSFNGYVRYRRERLK